VKYLRLWSSSGMGHPVVSQRFEELAAYIFRTEMKIMAEGSSETLLTTCKTTSDQSPQF
jgi:hypothetical protein